VVARGCHLGIAIDGDGDRVILVDEKGRVADGDQILATLAMQLRRTETLRGGGVVATIMSNLALEHFLDSEGLDLIRTKVGDRYVVARMRADGYNLGGEQSGHIVLRDHATTGDGLVAALQVLAFMVRSGKPASECLSLFEPYPQHMVNVRLTSPTDPLEHPRVREAIADTEARLSGTGRLVIRKSGTEPLVRVMVEASDATMTHQCAEDLAGVVRAHL
jgi:phosphoglucosamine mutase